MKKIVFTSPGGRLAVVHPNPALFDPDSRERHELASRKVEFSDDAEILAWLLLKDVPADATDVRVVDESAIPADRSRRADWRLPAGKNRIKTS